MKFHGGSKNTRIRRDACQKNLSYSHVVQDRFQLGCKECRMFRFQNNVIIAPWYQLFDKMTSRGSRCKTLIEQVTKIGFPPIAVVIHVDAGYAGASTARF